MVFILYFKSRCDRCAALGGGERGDVMVPYITKQSPQSATICPRAKSSTVLLTVAPALNISSPQPVYFVAGRLRLFVCLAYFTHNPSPHPTQAAACVSPVSVNLCLYSLLSGFVFQILHIREIIRYFSFSNSFTEHYTPKIQDKWQDFILF